MKPWRLQCYSLGNCSITILANEIVIIYRRKNNVIIKSIVLTAFKKALAISLCVLALFCVATIIIARVHDLYLSEGSWYDELRKKAITQEEFKEPRMKQPLKVIQHTIKSGETLSEIAHMYGVSMDTICGCNKLESYDLVHEGQVLKIPNKDGLLIRIQQGQTLPNVAKKYNVALQKIIAENNIQNPDFVNVGQDIFIPDAKPLDVFKGYLWPVATKYITSGYGWRKDPLYGNSQFHQGIDIRANYEWVRVSKYGRVSYAGWLGGYGKVVVVTHPGGDKTLYGHLSRIIVKVGQYVKQGQIIAKSGNTGNSTGPHLHFEIIRKGQHINPYAELRKK